MALVTMMPYRNELEFKCLVLEQENEQLLNELIRINIKYENLRNKKPFIIRCQEFYISYIIWRDNYKPKRSKNENRKVFYESLFIKS